MKTQAVKKEYPSDLNGLQRQLGHTFARPELLEHALTHSSHANEIAEDSAPGDRRTDNEQLEFLGDSVLGFVTSNALVEKFPNYNEGQLSKARAHLVSAKHLVEAAKQLSLGDYLRLGRGEERSGGRNKSALLVDALEALIAALYLDGGLETARRFVLENIVNPALDELRSDPEMALSDQKSALQEWLQATGSPQPSYQVVQAEGPDHKKIFTVELRVSAEPKGGKPARPFTSRAQGSTKKLAEQKAAKEALEFLKQHASK
jgi:ribonuclease-3